MTRLSSLSNVPQRGHADKIVQVMDPVHNFIDISQYPVIEQLIQTPHFQRLRRLQQLGLISTVYPNSTHSRFAHSLGVMHVFLVLFDSVAKRSQLSRDRIGRLRPVGAVAALLHDIGHGPFSHASEKFLDGGNFDHEVMTQEIILDTEIADILKKNNIRPDAICDILKHEVSSDIQFVSQLISSQLDADRIDYLMRDALFTGVPYGQIDIYRIANTLSIWKKSTPAKSLKDTIVVSQKGIEAVEDYLMGRYHMYRGVYYHKTVRCVETILINLFKRASKQGKNGAVMADIGKKVTPATMLALDDYVFYSAIQGWLRSPDKILRDLSTRIMNRDLFKAYHLTRDDVLKLELKNLHDIKKEFVKRRLDPEYYLILDSETKPGYKPYMATDQDSEKSATNHIMVATGANELQEISRVSPLVKAISDDNDNSVRIFYPKGCLPDIRSILSQNSSSEKDSKA